MSFTDFQTSQSRRCIATPAWRAASRPPPAASLSLPTAPFMRSHFRWDISAANPRCPAANSIAPPSRNLMFFLYFAFPLGSANFSPFVVIDRRFAGGLCMLAWWRAARPLFAPDWLRAVARCGACGTCGSYWGVDALPRGFAGDPLEMWAGVSFRAAHQCSKHLDLT